MRARKLRRLTAWCLCLAITALVEGCQDSPPATEAPISAVTDAGSLFDPQTTGTITGQVVWDGETPRVPPFVAPVPPWDPKGQDFLQWPNPNAPVIDAKSRGVKDAVVFLRDVDPRLAKPWDYPPVCVEQRHYQIHVLQDGLDGRCGIVGRGDAIEMVSRQPVFHSLHAGGANFFTLAFPDPDKPLTRRLDHAGLVELISAAGCFWMRGYLFVADHPYYCRTDCHGNFTLAQVPAGTYELVCCHPNWHKQSHDRDPESTLICRLYFQAPIEVVRQVEVQAEAVETVSFTLTTDAFWHQR